MMLHADLEAAVVKFDVVALFEAMAKGLSSYKVLTPKALEKKLKPPRGVDEIDDEWVDGLKKSWKLLVKEGKNFEGRNAQMPSKPDLKLLYNRNEAAKRYMERVVTYLENFRSMLLIDKGFWTTAGQSKAAKKLPASERPFAKATDEIQAAIKAARSAKWDIESTISDLKEGGKFGKWAEAPQGDWYEKVWGDRAMQMYEYDWNLPLQKADGGLQEADRAMSKRLFPHLKKLIKNWGGAHGRLHTGHYEPDTVHVGGFTVIFKDSPIDPSRYKEKVYAPGAAFDEPPTEPMGYRHPRQREESAKLVKRAVTFLKKANMGHLIYGKIFFNPEVSGHFGPSKSQNRPYSIRASGSYQRSGDHIDLYYSSPGWTPSTIVHELGHRYWAKFMSAEDKHRFKQFFGKAKAASDYGMTNPEEDFCELFAAYVIGREWSKAGGKNLDRYQRQRMEAFLGKKRKLESVSTTLHDSLLEAIAMQRA